MVLLIVLIALPLLLLLVFTAITIRLLLSLRISAVTTCRGCGENLWGRPKLRICPSCGGDRRVPRSQRGGDGGRSRIRRRRWALALVAPPAVACAIWIALVLAFLAAGSLLDPYKPAWLLVSEAVRAQQDLDSQNPMYSGADQENAALTELTNRMRQLAQADIRAVADRALAFQQDDVASGKGLSISHGRWLDFVETAHEHGYLSAAQWDRYLHQGVDQCLSVNFRQQVRRGDPLVLSINCLPALRARMQISYDTDYVVTVAGRAVGKPQPRHETANAPAESSNGITVDLPADLLASLTDGVNSASVTATVSVRGTSQPPNSPPMYSKTLTLQGPWILLSASTPSLAIDANIQPATLEQLAGFTQARFEGGGSTLYIDANYSMWTPYSWAYRAYVRGNGQEWEVGHGIAGNGVVAVKFNASQRAGAGSPPPPVTLPSTVDVIIRPDDDSAVRTTFCTSTWRGEIVVPHVLVQ